MSAAHTRGAHEKSDASRTFLLRGYPTSDVHHAAPTFLFSPSVLVRAAGFAGSGGRSRRGRARTFRCAVPEFPEVGAAIVRGQEVQKPLVVVAAHAKQLQQRPVVATRRGQPPSDQLAHVVPRDVARDEQRIDVIPERVAGVDDGGVQLVGDLRAPLARGQHRLRAETHHFRQHRDVHDVVLGEPYRLLDDVLQLADVARPAIPDQHLSGRVGDDDVADPLRQMKCVMRCSMSSLRCRSGGTSI